MSSEHKPAQPPEKILVTLLEKPRTFSFMQAVRLLILGNAARWRSREDFLRHGLKIHPDLSLAHPGTDITDIKKLVPKAEGETPEDVRVRYELTVTFLALYGASSPLPTFYTEELVEEAREDRDDSRRFLDLFNQNLYVLYYRAFNAYKLGQRTLEEQDRRLAELQQCLLGMGLAGLREAAGVTTADLACIRLATRHTRTARGLAHWLELMLGVRHIAIEQCVPRRMPVMKEQQGRLGQARLGEDIIGTSVMDLEGAFRIHIFAIDQHELCRLLPENGSLHNIGVIVRRYLNTPLSWDFVLHTRPNSVKPASLGACRLGSSTFLSEYQSAPGRQYRFVPRWAGQCSYTPADTVSFPGGLASRQGTAKGRLPHTHGDVSAHGGDANISRFRIRPLGPGLKI